MTNSGLTDIQRSVLALADRLRLPVPKLAGAVARERGITIQAAQSHVDRLVRKGYLSAAGPPAEAVSLLREVGAFLATRHVAFVSNDHARLMSFRERIAEVVGGEG